MEFILEILVENVSGKAYLNVISTLDEEVEVQVPTLQLKPLDKLFDDYESNMEIQNNQEKGDENEIINDNKDTINKRSTTKENQMLKGIKKMIKYKDEKVKRKIKNRIMRRNDDLRKSSNLGIYQEEDFQTSSKTLDPEILGGGNYQTSSKNFNPRITEERF